MQGVYLHVVADSLGSLGVIVSTLCVKYFNLVIADAICSLLISTTILLSGIPFLKMTVKQLVLQTPAKLKRKLS